MRQNCVRSIVVHLPEGFDPGTLSEKVSRFHAEVIERHLNQKGLTPEDRIQVVDKIIQTLRSANTGLTKQ